MVIGIGTDILKLSHIDILMKNMEDPFFKKIYTKNEYNFGLKSANPLTYFAGRFAGKEAVFKTFNIDGNAILLKEIEILKKECGAPLVNLFGNAKVISEKRGIFRMELSLSYDTDYVVAYAIAIGER
ncbi:MAG: holo-ACP synthase [Clostridiales bacterium]